jgi:hypothetical protein
MLGTNDLKNRFSVSAMEIACSIGRLVDTVKKCETAYTGAAPKVLVICPAPLGDLSKSPFSEVLIGGKEKSLALASALKKYCKENNVEMIDAGAVVKTSDVDGVHLEESEHSKLGKAIALKVKDMMRE